MRAVVNLHRSKDQVVRQKVENKTVKSKETEVDSKNQFHEELENIVMK